MDYVMPGMNGAADPSQRLLSPSLTLSLSLSRHKKIKTSRAILVLIVRFSLSRHTWLVVLLIGLLPGYYRCGDYIQLSECLGQYNRVCAVW